MDPALGPVFALVHSPLVGPATWTPVAGRLAARGHEACVADLTGLGASGPPYWPAAVDAVRRALAGVPEERPVVVVAHSNAGRYVPVLCDGLARTGRGVAGRIFVDARLPGADDPAAEAEFLDHLRTLADPAGVLPRWTDWFPAADLGALIPDERTRRAVVEEQPRLPLSCYEQSLSLPVPAGWDDGPAAYVLFSEAYEDQARRARERGWPVYHLPGGHLHQVVAPDAVADTLLSTVPAYHRRDGHRGA